MSRSNSNALESGDANDFAYGNEQPTKRLPMLTPFALAQEARRLDEEARKRDEAARAALDDERTVTIGAEENERLLASVLALGAEARKAEAQPRGLVRDERYTTDDEPTLDAPSPVTSVQAKSPAVDTLRALAAVPEIAAAPATPAAFVSEPVSGFRPRITPELAKAAREAHAAEDARLRSGATFTIRLAKRTTETYLVAGIWAMALSLIAVLMFMASSA
jgi:hypothetical protein